MARTEFSASSELSHEPHKYEERSDLHSIHKPDKPNEAWFHFALVAHTTELRNDAILWHWYKEEYKTQAPSNPNQPIWIATEF